MEALGGDPGVYTADWAGPDRDWNRAMRLVEEKLQAKGATTPDRRRAYFACTLCVIWPDGEERIYEGRAHGTLAWPPRGQLEEGALGRCWRPARTQAVVVVALAVVVVAVW